MKLFFDDAIEQRDAGLLTHVMEPDNGPRKHGRLDERTTGATSGGGEANWLCKRHPDWQDLRGIVSLERRSDFRGCLEFATGTQTTHRRYYLTSRDPRQVGARRLG